LGTTALDIDKKTHDIDKNCFYTCSEVLDLVQYLFQAFNLILCSFTSSLCFHVPTAVDLPLMLTFF